MLLSLSEFILVASLSTSVRTDALLSFLLMSQITMGSSPDVDEQASFLDRLLLGRCELDILIIVFAVTAHFLGCSA